MNLRRRINQEPIQLQLAPMIDVILFLLCFFLLTWNLARYEQDLQVKVPVARNGTPPSQLPGEVIINLKSDGKGGSVIELERTSLSLEQLQQKLTAIAQVLDTCRASKLTNIAFATNPPDKAAAN
jgi:biopolymer transport protein ExbD